jgi:hypothetical protein
MNQQNLELNVPQVFLARLFATVLTPFIHGKRDKVALREMNAAFKTAQIDPIFGSDFRVDVNPECSSTEFEVAVNFQEYGSIERRTIYITEADLALGQVDALEEFAMAVELHGRNVQILMDKARSCPANPRDVALANTHFEDAFFRLRRSHAKERTGGY